MRVLVVEDVPDVALVFAGLIRACGHKAQTALNAKDAIRIAKEFRPQTVFVDIGLPDGDGYELAAELRTIGGDEEMRLISVSGREIDPVRAHQVGLHEHLMKPVRMASLLPFLTCEV